MFTVDNSFESFIIKIGIKKGMLAYNSNGYINSHIDRMLYMYNSENYSYNDIIQYFKNNL